MSIFHSIKHYGFYTYLLALEIGNVRGFIGCGWKYNLSNYGLHKIRQSKISLGTISNGSHTLGIRNDKMDSMTMEDNERTIFDKIVSGEIPCKKVFEDDLVLAFHDINPQAPTHILLIPKNRTGLTRLSRANEEHQQLLGHMMVKVAQIVKDNNLGDFRLVINNGPGAGQEVYHLHMHILAGRSLRWPPG
ncbi:bifunctional HIT-like domain/Histidine triad [Babesia duncani]|uniref:Bifunctional HIT-like domain/Histidine triad n=1 Tax=Babesia duncani TaxID=323732 RepID=A0AAD9PKW2_9APIC|nr:bifunctional HIT-like domain/Histidine triad [Babesia duncani]